jgi:hypothetical protein
MQPASLPATDDNGSRALGSGSRLVIGGILTALITAALVIAVTAPGGSSPAKSKRPAPAARARSAAGTVNDRAHALHSEARPVKTSGTTYGYVPAWLGRAKVPVGRVVTATPAHRWLAVQGDTVRVKLPGAQLLATVVGPAVPQEGHFPVPRTSPCTFTVTLAGATAPLAITPAQFAAIDEQGRIHKLKVTTQDGQRPPTHVSPGKTVELKLHAVLPTGQGRIMWAPVSGRPLVQWDFDLEID